MLSQFTKEGLHATLANLFNFPKDVYPVGRLDTDSEGLLILTNDKRLNSLLLDPKHAHKRTYLIQVEGVVTKEAKEKLEQGVSIEVNGKKYTTRPSKAELLNDLQRFPERNPPIRFRKNIPTSWIRLTLTEGKNRQVRKMTAKVGFPTLRLIREKIEDITLESLELNVVKEIYREELFKLLNIHQVL